ncbi:MAG TPA: FAD-dependent monooxygenase [Burkholderiales bacterium]|nr:FAD-dependent monooxygenase [Burkholderiales bacterium]
MRELPEAADVVVAGGGSVGATLALALRDSGRSVVLVEPQAKPSGPLRPIALSHGSRLVLERVGVFDRVAATPIEAIHVSQAGGFGRTLIRREDHDLPALGYVTDASQVAAALLAAAEAERVAGRVATWRAARERVTVTVDCGDVSRAIAARLLVLADGGQLAGDDLAMRDYGQTAIVATVRPQVVHRGRAWERFTPEGPLALLPFGGTAEAQHYIYALVWSVRTAEASRLAALPDDRFLAMLGERFGRRLGRFVDAGARASYPLRLWFRRSGTAGPRTVAVGNAAQTLHPVAGQGLNLGLRDAAELADLVLCTDPARVGDSAFVAAFGAGRRIDRYAAIGVTDFLVRVFSNDDAPLRFARGLGLAALDLVPPARRLLARRMMLGARGLP